MSNHVLKLPPVKLINSVLLGVYIVVAGSAMLVRIFGETPGVKGTAQLILWVVIIFTLLKGHVLVQSVYTKLYHKRVKEFLSAEYGNIINPDSLTKEQLKLLSTPNAVTEGYLSEPAFLHVRLNTGEQTGLYSLMTSQGDSYLINRYNNVRLSNDPKIGNKPMGVVPAIWETQEEYDTDAFLYAAKKEFRDSIRNGLAYTVGIPHANGDKDLHLLFDDEENFKVLLLWSSLDKVNAYIASQRNNSFIPSHLEVIELTDDDVDNIFDDVSLNFTFRVGLDWAPVPLPTRGLIFPTRNMVINA